MKKINKYTLLLILFIAIISSCKKKEDDKSPFDNVVFIQQAEKISTETVNLKDKDVTIERSLQAQLAYPANENVVVEYSADLSLTDKYNKTYNKTVTALPSKYFTLKSTTVTVAAGQVSSGALSQAVISFSNLSEIKRGDVYVLPITLNVVSGNVSALNASKTYYYIIQKGAPITVVADITANYLSIPAFSSGGGSNLNNLTQVTFEALVKGDDWDSKGKIISSVMGIEGYFLMRIGDGGGYPAGQIQFAGNAGNFPNADLNKALKKGEWNHIALTYDKATNVIVIYVNGKEQSRGSRTFTGNTISLARPDFYIGKSYDNDRDIRGQISECRIWNKVRTQTEIADNMYELDPKTAGLQAYWKFDEGTGVDVKDYSPNGYNAKANAPIKWIPVSLP
jgi:hypothetical protein